MTKAELPTITQADREEAANLLEVWGLNATAAAAREGNGDNTPDVQAFARHRTRSLTAQDGILSLLREQHEAMAEVMQLRRMSKDQEQRNKAQAAIEVWRKVEAALLLIGAPKQ